MFGLEQDKQGEGKRTPEETFELELKIRDPAEHKKLKKEVEERIHRLKHLLRTGENQAAFEQYGVLLHGYTSLEKLMERMQKQK